MNDYLDFKEMQRKLDDIAKTTYKCKCGHTIVIANKDGRAICNYCGHMAFINKQKEFEYRVKENLFRERRKNNERKRSRN